MESRKILILGATSLIAQEAARNFAKAGWHFCLVSRNEPALEEIKKDLIVQGAKEVLTIGAELSDISGHQKLLTRIFSELPDLDTVLLAYGSLGDQDRSEASAEEALKEIQTNFTSPVSLLTEISNRFEKAGRGQIAVITSVAGDIGRKKNYIYGCAKGGLNLYLQGLRNRLHSKNVRVLTIKPGFVDTPMTAHLKKGPLFADAKSVGERIYKAMLANEDVLYVPWFWRFILLIIKLIPEKIYKRLSI